MKHWLMLSALTVLLFAACSDETALKTAPKAEGPHIGDPHAGLSIEDRVPGASGGQSLGDSGGPLELDAITLTAPAGWPQMLPSSSFVAAEFTLQRADGDDADGRLTVSTAGGTVEANIDRWKGQFGAQSQQESQEEIDVAGMKVTVVDLSGDFKDQRGPFAPAVERSGYRMIAAIIPVNGQLHFIKATGPEKTIASHADEIHSFIRTVQLKQ
jgi:hypothetical protein